jgi:hypothetical protein
LTHGKGIIKINTAWIGKTQVRCNLVEVRCNSVEAMCNSVEVRCNSVEAMCNSVEAEVFFGGCKLILENDFG